MAARVRARSGHMDATDVRRASTAVADMLASGIECDWTVVVPHLTWTIAETVAHIAETLLWYSIDLAATGVDLEALQPSVRTDAAPSQLAATIPGIAGLLAHVVAAAPPDARGFHPAGMADPSGFAAMGCDELLIHGWDAARGLDEEFAPDGRLAASVLGRLFPWVAPEPDPWTALLWANGRLDLPSRLRPVDWRWHCAPLDQWDGSVPH